MSDVTVSVVESTTSVTVSGDVVDINVVESPVTVSTGTSGPQGASYNQGDPIYERVRNSTGSTLLKGQIVYLSGATGNHVNVSLALASGDGTSARTIGWISENIANNAEGFVMMFGYLEGIDTSAASAVGDILYLSPTVPGGWTSTKPSAPQHMVYVGVCVRKNPSNGAVSVHIQNGYELGELHDVAIASVADGDLLEYDSATDLWKNVPQSALTVAQSQVTNLTTDLAGKANLAGGNAFTGAQTVTASAIGQVPLTLAGTSGQTADLFSVTGTVGTTSIDSQGLLVNTGPVRTNGLRNPSVQTVISLATAGINVFSNNPTAGNVGLVVRGAASQSANLLELQSSAAAVLARFSSAGALIINNTGAASALLSITGTGGGVMSVSQTGAISTNAGLTVNGGTSALGGFHSASATPVLVVGATNQVADLQIWRTLAGTTLGGVNANAQIFTGSTNPLTTSTGGATTATSGDGTTATVSTASAHSLATGDRVTVAGITPTGYNGTYIVTVVSAFSFSYANATTGAQTVAGTVRVDAQASVVSRSAATVGLLVRGATSQAASLFEVQDSTGASRVRINQVGNSTFSGNITSQNNALFTPFSAATVPLTVQGAASQTASFIEVQNSSATTLFRVNSSGYGVLPLGLIAGGAAPIASTTNTMYATAATSIGLAIRGAASQTANLQQWQISDSTVVARVLADGQFVSSAINTSNNYSRMLEANSGGTLQLTKMTAQAGNAGADIGRIYFRDGTILGTLKLVVRAGAAGAETTILDNIPQ